MEQVDAAIAQLIQYGLKCGLIVREDVRYTVNRLLEALSLDEYHAPEQVPEAELEEILKVLLDYACEEGLCGDTTTERDLLDTRLMGCLTPRPSEVQREFWEKYRKDPVSATDWYYTFSRSTDYIRTYRVKKDLKWTTPTEYGDLVVTVNLSKPEKDPKAIAAAKKAKQSGYPACMLCWECEGYAGRLNFPARQNHRVIPLKLGEENWGFQYSPYVYYNEHCIVFHEKHIPMQISGKTFERLFHFIDLFPHYFIGSNADLPIVGGSILTHEHFQGGNFTFPMAKAPIETPVKFAGYEDVEAGIVKWPMSVLRLRGKDASRLTALGTKILERWRGYTDEDAFIFAETDGEPHNTVTPIARKRGGCYELDLVLRNNITTEEHPLGVFHPHQELHHIKKENIGLIEVMGLAVLPARLKAELAALRDAAIAGRDFRSSEETRVHAEWADKFLAGKTGSTPEELDALLREEVGKVFLEVLKCAGVFKRTEEGKQAFLRFLRAV